MRIYLDTNVLRHFSIAFANRELTEDLKAKIVLSPIGALELMSQLCDEFCGTSLCCGPGDVELAAGSGQYSGITTYLRTGGGNRAR
jgi:hypothetical protein